MPKLTLPSQAGRRALLNLHRGRPAGHGLYGTAAGGLQGTLTALRKRGLIDHTEQLTDAGRAMLNRLTVAREVTHGA